MRRTLSFVRSLPVAIALTCLAIGCGLASRCEAQSRVTPAQSRGGKLLEKPWATVPDGVRQTRFPTWAVPTDLDDWRRHRRAATRDIVLQCLGELPDRPAKLSVRVLSREDRGDYWQERFEFANGIDALVPGILLLPKTTPGRVPAIVGLHGHGGSSETICTEENNPQCVGPDLVRRGFAVAAIDTYFCGARSPKGRGDSPERYRHLDEGTLFRLSLWQGRTLWGLMLRDQRLLLDYLQSRPEIDPERIGVTGMSMGGTGSWWLAAVDDRIRVAVGVAGFTRYEQLLAHNKAHLHGVYYFVPGLLRHFDTEAIFSLIAPRPLLMLSGDRDAGLPLDGIEILESKLGHVYRLHGQPERFHSIVYENTAHEYLPEMRTAMGNWFERHLSKPQE